MTFVYILAAILGAAIGMIAFGAGLLPALFGSTIAAIVLTVWVFSDGSDNETDL